MLNLTQVIAILIIGVILIMILLFAITKSSSRYYKDLEKINQAYGNGKVIKDDENWLDNSEERIRAMFENDRQAKDKVEQIFDQFHGLMDTWDELLKDHKEALESEDAIYLFRIKMRAIEYICKELSEGRRTFIQFEDDLDYHINSLSELLRNLAKAAHLRELSFPYN